MAVAGHDLCWVVAVGDEMQHGEHQHGYRVGEVDQFADLGEGEHAGHIAQVGAHGHGVRFVGQQGLAVRDDDRVDVD